MKIILVQDQQRQGEKSQSREDIRKADEISTNIYGGDDDDDGDHGKNKRCFFNRNDD